MTYQIDFEAYPRTEGRVTIPEAINLILEFIAEYPGCSQRDLRGIKLWSQDSAYDSKIRDLTGLMVKGAVLINKGTAFKARYEISPDFEDADIDDIEILRDDLTQQYKDQVNRRKAAKSVERVSAPVEDESPAEATTAPATATPEPVALEPKDVVEVAQQWHEDVQSGLTVTEYANQFRTYIENFIEANGRDPEDTKIQEFITKMLNAFRNKYIEEKRQAKL